jgi:hypothetical protein
VVSYRAFEKVLTTELCGQVVSTPASYTGGSGLKSLSRDRLSWNFSGFSQSLQPNAGIIISVRPRQFSSTSLVVHNSHISHLFDAISYSLSHGRSIVK